MNTNETINGRDEYPEEIPIEIRDSDRSNYWTFMLGMEAVVFEIGPIGDGYDGLLDEGCRHNCRRTLEETIDA